MSITPLPYCDDINYIRSGKKGDCIPRDDNGNPNEPEPNTGIVTEIADDPVVKTEAELQALRDS
jgi:hypothetical protein